MTNPRPAIYAADAAAITALEEVSFPFLRRSQLYDSPPNEQISSSPPAPARSYHTGFIVNELPALEPADRIVTTKYSRWAYAPSRVGPVSTLRQHIPDADELALCGQLYKMLGRHWSSSAAPPGFSAYDIRNGKTGCSLSALLSWQEPLLSQLCVGIRGVLRNPVGAERSVETILHCADLCVVELREILLGAATISVVIHNAAARGLRDAENATDDGFLHECKDLISEALIIHRSLLSWIPEQIEHDPYPRRLSGWAYVWLAKADRAMGEFLASNRAARPERRQDGEGL